MLHAVRYDHSWMLRACGWCVALTLILTLSLPLTLPVAAIAADSIPAKELTLLGLYGGVMNTIAVDGNDAFIGQGSVIVTMDVTDPTQPQRVGQSDILPGTMKAIAISHDYAYAALGYEGLAVLDVSNLTTPNLVTVVDTLGSAEDVVVVGNYLMVASGLAGLRIFDIGDPTQPTPSGAVNTPGFAQQLVVDGNRVYIADGISGLRIVDVTTPATPVELGFFDTPEEINGVAYGNNFAYIGGKNSYELRAIDVTDPAHPREESIVNVGATLSGMVLVGDYLYLRMNMDVLAIYNSDPFLLNQVGSWGNYPISDVAVVGGYAFVVGGSYDFGVGRETGLFVLDVDPPAAMQEVGRVPSLNHANIVAVANNVAYTPDDYGGIAVLDVSQPVQIAQKARLEPCEDIWHQVTIAENILVIDSAGHWTGIRRLCFFSLTNPQAPQRIGAREVAENQWYSPRVAAQGNRIFVAEGYMGATLLNPDDLGGAALGVYPPAHGSIRSLAIPATGNRLFAATEESLLFIDVSTPAAPQLLGELAGPYGGHMNGRGDLVFAYNSATKALDIIDIHTPESPQVIASIGLPGDNAKRILPVDNLVVIANGSAGVRVIDVSTPSAPKEVAFYDPPADVSGLAIEGNRIYVAANSMGLIVLQIDEDILPQPSRLSLPLLVRTGVDEPD